MLYRIKMVSDEVEGFLREYKIESEATFLDLNNIILSSCQYEDGQLTSFYLCNREWERREQVTREDMGLDDDLKDIYVMDKTRLSELIEDEGQRLQFLFDTFNDRCFYLEVKEFITGERLSEPIVTRSKGDAPEEILVDDTADLVPAAAKGKKGAAASDSDDLYDESAFIGGGAYNDDELDLDGFEISDGSSF